MFNDGKVPSPPVERVLAAEFYSRLNVAKKLGCNAPTLKDEKKVITSWTIHVADLLKTLGIKVEEIKSSPLKAAPNGFEPTSPEARAAIEAIVSDSYAWFRGLVKSRRQLDDASLERVADGRVFTGRQGIALKLVDELGDERTAVAWLAKEKNIDPKTPVRDYRLRDRLSDLPFLHTAVVATLDAVGLSSFARRLEEWGAVQAVERLNLDGLLALWHPPSTN